MPNDRIITLERVCWWCDIIYHQIIAILTVYILTITLDNNDINNIGTWHIVLTSVGYIFFMAEAIILFAKQNLVTLSLTRPPKTSLHIILMIISVICVTIGISLKIYQKSTHFTSPHAIIGLISWIFVWITVIVGGFSKYRSNFIVRPIIWKFSHNLLGIIAFVLGIISLGYGLSKRSFQTYSSDDTILAATVAMGIAAILSVLTALYSLYSQFRTIFF